MSKIIQTTLIIFLCTTVQCNTQEKIKKTDDHTVITQKKQKISRIELKEQTRGTNRSITFDAGSIITSLNENISKSEISSSEWENIVKQTSLIDLSKIASYESPTTGRFSDRALASTIIITSNGKTYQSASFDAGIPPKELEGLYRLLKSKSGITKRGEPKLR
ncbi:hypothetical protein [Chryseobacterium sp. Leaf201]|uniref:hypothetical protein n=1 Tax=Chryseobacterium sp. Leaf201 TaxID=1735672 RepID=UPI0006FAE832|nr:hypothetical protein [Chryseobacterium sp. Leaf201]KQM62022.1 hypothetical protein ASE55_18920 [Chryseobacterium sp. Leaf201]